MQHEMYQGAAMFMLNNVYTHLDVVSLQLHLMEIPAGLLEKTLKTG